MRGGAGAFWLAWVGALAGVGGRPAPFRLAPWRTRVGGSDAAIGAGGSQCPPLRAGASGRWPGPLEAPGLGRGPSPEWAAGGSAAARGRFDPGGGGPVFCQFVMRIGLLVLT
ncbi:hypothetical protein GCM10009578_078630 [Streptomyces rhizosphaericus]